MVKIILFSYKIRNKIQSDIISNNYNSIIKISIKRYAIFSYLSFLSINMLIKLRSHRRRSLELWLHVLMVYEWIKMLLVISITMMITISMIAVITVMWLQIHWGKWRNTISSDLRSGFGYQMTKWNFVIIIFNNVMVRWRSEIIMKRMKISDAIFDDFSNFKVHGDAGVELDFLPSGFWNPKFE